MIYSEFERIISASRLYRYYQSCGQDTRKAMTLYRLNMKLSGEFLSVVCSMEILYSTP